MKFRLGVGQSDFASLRLAGDYYVDKSEFIYELVEETGNTVSLFTRPRRFGKTLMMRMMLSFFDIRKDSRSLFEGLKIMEHREFCERWMNQYPVLFLSFKDVEGLDFHEAYGMLKTILADTCKAVPELADSDKTDPYDNEVFTRLRANTSKENDVKRSIKTIMRMMYAVYGKKVILLMDEYDVPLARASEKNTEENRYYPQMLNMIRGIMSSALKDNEYLEFAAITGCLRIAKESIFTGTNNFASYSVLDKRFSRYFGFVQEEIDELLRVAQRPEAAKVIKEWYDGYVFGNSMIYCPWDVINHISSLRWDKNARPKNYWKNTSHNGILLNFVKRTDFDVTRQFEILLNDGTIVQTISDGLTYDTLHTSEKNLWSVLFMTGYLTKADASEDGEEVALRIPNKEIASIFEDTVIAYFRDSVDASEIKDFIKALWDEDTETATRIISNLLWYTISYHDYHEDYYHAFLSGIFVGQGYSVESNREWGLGRPDILLRDKKNRRAIIIEAKKSMKEADMEKDCEKALQQMDGKKYAEGLYGYTQIYCYGIAFFKKQARVKGEKSTKQEMLHWN